MDATTQTLISIGIWLVIYAGFGIWLIRLSIAIRKEATAYDFHGIKQSVDFVERNLDRLDGQMGRIECRLEQRSDLKAWEVQTLRSDLAFNRRELARIASTPERRASGA